MPNLKAAGIMAIWTVIAFIFMQSVGVAEHFRDPLWAIGTAIFLLITLMVNVWIYFKVAGDYGWKWFK